MLNIAKRKMIVAALALGAAMLSTSGNKAWAASSMLSDNNSTLTYSTVTDAISWTVDGVNEFGGTPAGGDLLQYYNGSSFVPLSSLNVVSSSLTGNVGTATLSGTLDGDNFTVALQVILSGGNAGSGASGISEQITVNNLGPAASTTVKPAAVAGNPVDFMISDTFDANLNATPSNDTLTLSPSGAPNKAVQTDPTGVKLTYSTTPTPSQFAIINNGSSSSATGPQTGNEAFNFVWDLSLAPGDTGIISNAISLSGQGSSTVVGVPLPSAAWSALATLTGLGVLGIVRRKRAKA
jgi:hypothetical protein